MWTDNKNYVIYKINFPNGKVYIGLTSDMKKRSNDHMSAARKGYRFLVCKAINKYKDSITFEILCNGKTYEDLYELEKGFIKQYKSFDTEFGYNCTEGGEGNLGGKNTGELKKKPVIELSTHTVYKSSKEACERLNISRTEICNVLNGKKNHTKGYKFEFYVEGKEYILTPRLEKISNRNYVNFEKPNARGKPSYNKGKPSKLRGRKLSEDTKNKLRLKRLDKKLSGVDIKNNTGDTNEY